LAVAFVVIFTTITGLGWQSQPARALSTFTQDFTSSGSITIPNLVVSMTVTAWGGGGGGGGGAACLETSVGNNALSVMAGGGGGGGSGYKNSWTWSGGFTSDTLSFTVGGGGGGGNGWTGQGVSSACGQWANDGNNGGATTATFKNQTVTGNGGYGGSGGRGSAYGYGGSGYDAGKPGTGCSATSGSCSVSGGNGGAGSDGFGGGGKGGGAKSPFSGTRTGDKGGGGSGGRVRVTYTYYNVTVTDVSPALGPLSGGTSVTITGTDFEDISAAKIGGVDCQSFTYVSPTEVTCVTPPGVATGLTSVSVTTTRGSPVKDNAFLYYLPPVVGDVMPDTGSILGGETVDIIGQNFMAQTTVEFDGQQISCNFVSDAKLTCVTPKHAVGAVDVTAITEGSADTLPDGYTYVPPPMSADRHYFAADTSGQTFKLTGSEFATADEFQEVEYLTFNGSTNYIDTGVNPTGNIKITANYQYNVVTAWGTIFGACGTNCVGGAYWFGSDDALTSYAFGYGNSNNPYKTALFSGYVGTTNRHTVVANNDTVQVDDSGLYTFPAATSGGSPTTTTTIHLAAISYTGTPYYMFNGRIYSVEIEKDGSTDDRNFVPVKCNVAPACASETNTGVAAVNGEYGMFDTLHNVFYHSGAGTLTGGPAVAAGTTWPLRVDKVSDVKIGGASVAFTINNANEITVTAPNRGYTSTPLEVAVVGDAYTTTLSGTDGINYLALTAPTPAKGSALGGTEVVISGSGLSGSSPAITMPSNSATDVSVTGDTKLTFKTPAGSVGMVDVVIDDLPDGENLTLDDAWEYVTILSLSISGLDAPNDDLTLTGAIGQLWTRNLAANVKTDNEHGYNLTIEASEPRLTCVASGGPYYIQPLGSSLDALSDMVDNHWGYNIGVDNATAPDTWAGLTDVPTPIKSHGSATTLVGEDTFVWFGTRVNYEQPVCSYVGAVTLTAVARV
jgi:hypothetical protein